MVLTVIDRVARAFLDSLYMFALVAVIIKLFRVKNPSIRILLYLVAIFRPVVLLFDGFYVKGLSGFIRPLIRFVDPTGLITGVQEGPTFFYTAFNGNYASKILALIILSAILLIVFHLAKLALFYSMFKRLTAVQSSRHKELENIVDELARLAKTTKPKLRIVDTRYPTPFTVGWIEPTIIVSKAFAETISTGSIRLALAHEISHVKNGDNAVRWLAVVGRDIMFFSPFAWLAYKRIEREMEKACDSMSAEYAGKSCKDVAGMLVEVAEHYFNLKVKPLPLRYEISSMASNRGLLSERIDSLDGGGIPTKTSLRKKISIAVGCLILFLLQIAPVFDIGGRVVVF
ncbi:MAG: M56 family metallopeptidase [Actinobacteria bacterium]|nr:M56 family metallopeptidase [Actinomycetota bacterium]